MSAVHCAAVVGGVGSNVEAEATSREDGAARRDASLRRGFSWAFAGNLVHSACQWGLIASLARLGSPELVGQLALALSFSAPALMLTGLQLRGIQATDATARFRFSDYLALRLLGAGTALVLVLLASTAFGYSLQVVGVILLVALARAVESVSDVVHGLFQRQERLDLVGRSLVLRAPLSLVALAVAVHVTGSLAAGAVGMVSAAVGILLLYDLRHAATLEPHGTTAPRWSAETLKSLVRLAAPLGVALMLTSLTVSVPRWILERTSGEGALGRFAALSYFVTAGMLATSTLGQTAAARLARRWAEGARDAFSSLLLRLVVVAIAGGFVGVAVAHVAGPLLLSVFYGSDYAGEAPLLSLVMWSGVVGYPAVIVGFALTAMRRFVHQVPMMAAVVAVTTATSFALIPTMGIEGAVWSMIAGWAAQLAIGALAVRRAYAEAT